LDKIKPHKPCKYCGDCTLEQQMLLVVNDKNE